MRNVENWRVQQCEGAEYLCSILEFLLPEYVTIFGEEVMTVAPCIVYNDPNSECPLFEHTSPLSIRLSQTSLSFWAQTVYQLSHELCHYAMYQTKHDKSKTLSWFEEIVCEAMSLYALHYAARNWHKCKLAKCAPDFGNNIQEYLDNLLLCDATDGFEQCNTVEKLQCYERGQFPEKDRATHVRERNRIYEAVLRNPTEASCFLNYQWYIQPANGVVLDFDAWLKKESKDLVLQLFGISPIKDEEK